MKAIVCLFVLLGLVVLCRCAAVADDIPRGHVRAPDFTGASGWLNTEKPISIKDLRGQVVVLDFWTYCCINCMHVFPDLHYLEDKYQGKPLVIIGVHSGKFDEEKDAANIRAAVLRHNINHPVAVDNEYNIWNAYAVRGWPTLVLIDPRGFIVGEVSGEGHRDELDHAIATLLAEGAKNGTLAPPLHFRSERQSFKSGELEFPGKVLADGTGQRLFISDTNHNRVLMTTLDGKITETIGSGVVGLQNGPFATATFHQPQGLALSADGNTLFVADTENHAIRQVDLRQKTVTTLAGTGVQSHDDHPNGPAKSTPLSSPWDVARVGDQLYIAMAGTHQIWVIDLTSHQVSVFAGDGIEAAREGPAPDSSFAQPSGLATDGKTLYVASSEASTIQAIDLASGSVRNLAGSGDLFGFGNTDAPGSAARFQHPLGLALTADGRTLFVADTFNNRLRQIDTHSAAVSTLPGDFSEPGGLSRLDDTLYVADTNHHQIARVSTKDGKSNVLDVRR
jgi:sugar lactone lactonase YvrE/peroxiredoxin